MQKMSIVRTLKKLLQKGQGTLHKLRRTSECTILEETIATTAKTTQNRIQENM